MGSLAAGAVVLVRFPFSDLSQSKLRPAVVLADADRGDWILCQVTSRPYGDSRAVPIGEADFSRGGLRVQSHARPGKLFTANSEIIAADAGVLTPAGLTRIVDAVVAILRASRDPGTNKVDALDDLPPAEKTG